LSVLQFSFSAFWRPENAISVHSSKGHIMSMLLYIFVLGLEMSTKTNSFSHLLLH